MRYVITEKDGEYTATVPLPLADGRWLLVQGKASVADTYKDFGLVMGDEVGGVFDFLKPVGKFFGKITKNKAVRKVLKITKDVLKNPITTAALGVVTGGTAVPALVAANAGIRIAEAAVKAGKGTKKQKRIKKLMKLSMKKARQAKRKKKRIRKQIARTGKLPGRRLRIQKRKITRAQYAQRMKRLKAGIRGRTLPKTTTQADYMVKLHFA